MPILESFKMLIDFEHIKSQTAWVRNCLVYVTYIGSVYENIKGMGQEIQAHGYNGDTEDLYITLIDREFAVKDNEIGKQRYDIVWRGTYFQARPTN